MNKPNRSGISPAERIAEMTNEEIIFRGIQAHLGLTDEEASALIQSGKFPV